VADAVAAIRDGGFVIVTDSADRENEGDLIGAAEMMTPDRVAYLLRRTSGILCVALEADRLDELHIPLMTAQNTDARRTAFTVSVDRRDGTTTGISAADRARTIAALGDPASCGGDFSRPGHVFPLRYQEGGVLCRPGHTEAAVDLARLAGRSPAGVLCEIVNADGTMARRPELEALAAAEGLVTITIDDLIDYRWHHEVLVELVSTTTVPTRHGDFDVYCYRSSVDGAEHLAFVMGDVAAAPDVLVRVHSECVTGDALRSLRCDCGDQLDAAMARVAAAGRGVLVYLRGHEGRAIGLGNKIRAYALQDIGYDTVEANVRLGLPVDNRTYGVAGQILRALKVANVRLLTNNPDKLAAVASFLDTPVTRVPLTGPPRPENIRYLRTKEHKLGHLGAQVTAEPLLAGGNHPTPMP
jgi:3,4-dihydroxy 2-butanone 4-phosphate synthase/GTP cyclohydrolase II